MLELIIEMPVFWGMGGVELDGSVSAGACSIPTPRGGSSAGSSAENHVNSAIEMSRLGKELS